MITMVRVQSLARGLHLPRWGNLQVGLTSGLLGFEFLQIGFDFDGHS